MRLYEKKDNLIRKNPNLTEEQKQEIIEVLNKYPNLENNVDWNKNKYLTYEDFKETLSLIKEVEFTSLFTFIFSPRVGTPAEKMDDPIPYEEKSKWFRELLDIQEEIAAKRCSSMVGKIEKVLIEGETGKNDELTGRTSGNIIVELKAPA